MNCAPVVIPTLNRYICFKKCIESLQKNPLSYETELYIALDFPPNEKYYEGYNKIKEYLQKGISGFKSVHIISRNQNMGAVANAFDMHVSVFKKHDTIIMLEDDNEVSPCFLDFCNKGLEKYKNDASIIGINATNYVFCDEGFEYRDDLIKLESNVAKRQLAWHGLATWKDKYNRILQTCTSGKYMYYGLQLKNMTKLYKKSRCFFYVYIENTLLNRKNLPWYAGKLYPIDQVWDVYMMINDLYVVFPTISLTKDWGYDGSGVNIQVGSDVHQRKIQNIPISNLNVYDFKVKENLFNDQKENMIHDNRYYKSYKNRIKIWIKYVAYYLVHKVQVRK